MARPSAGADQRCRFEASVVGARERQARSRGREIRRLAKPPASGGGRAKWPLAGVLSGA